MTVHMDLFWKDLSPKIPALLATKWLSLGRAQTSLRFRPRATRQCPCIYPLNRNFAALSDRFYNGGYEENSRFAGARSEFGAKSKLWSQSEKRRPAKDL